MYSAWLIVAAILLAGLPSAATASDTSVPLIAPDGFETIHPIFVDKAGDKLDISARFLNNGQLLRLQDGRMMAAFNWDERAAISFSTDAGATWTEPRSLEPLPDPGVKNIGRVSALQTRDGTIWLFHYGWVSYAKAPATSRSDLWARKSTDGGETWKPPQIIWRGYTGMTQGAIETTGGHLLVPICYLGPKPPKPIATARFIGACIISTNHGETWGVADGIDIGERADLAQRFQNRLNGGTLEPSIAELKDGRIWMVMRTITGYLWESFSEDGGLTWSEPRPTHTTCGGPVYITRLKSGRIAMVWNQANWVNADTWGYPHGFDTSYVSLSDDEGRRWHDPVPHVRGGMRNVHSLVAEYAPGKFLLTIPGHDVLQRTTEARLLRSDSHQSASSGRSTFEAIDIGSRRELFVDEFLIADRREVELRLHLPIPGEIAITFDKPWEGSGSNFATVFRDGDRIRMYYIAAGLTDSAGMKMSGRASYACYAESKDGIHWVKPELGLVEFDGSRRNNIVWTMPKLDNFTPFKDSNPRCRPGEQYKAVGKGAGGGLYAFKSADGIHWSYLTNAPIITKGAFDTQNNAFWDSLRKRYWCYIRGVHDGIRDIRVATSSDFFTWTDPQLIEFVDSPDEALYTNQVEPYYRAAHLFLGFPTRYIERKFTSAAMEALPDPMHRQRRMKFSPRYGTALTDGLFMSSRDGYTYHRWDEAFIRPGPQRRDNWVYGDAFQSLGLLETPAMDTTAGPALSFYVGEDHWKDSHRLRRYTIRIDGFVSLHARQKRGEFVTKPLLFSGKALTLNFATAAAGSILVELQDEEGQPLSGFSLSDCDELFGDTLDRTVTWNEKSDVRGLIGKPIRIHMVLSEADLYSMKFFE